MSAATNSRSTDPGLRPAAPGLDKPAPGVREPHNNLPSARSKPPKVLIPKDEEEEARGFAARRNAVMGWFGFGVVRDINRHELAASLALWKALQKFDFEHAGSSADDHEAERRGAEREQEGRPQTGRGRGLADAVRASLLRRFPDSDTSDQDVGPEMAKTVVLHLRKQHYLRRRARLQGLCNLFALVALVCLVATPALAMVEVVAAELTGAYAVIFLLALVVARQRFRELDEDVVQIDQELDRIKVILQDPQRRALKLFQNHSLELRRYYGQVLRHAAFIFWVGVACIAVGFAVVGATLWLLVDPGRSDSVNQYVLGALGFAAGILANFVAMIYLRMYSTTVSSLSAFHNRLVETHRLHFANFLAAHVDQGVDRQRTLAQMAMTLAIQPREEASKNGSMSTGDGTRAALDRAELPGLFGRHRGGRPPAP